MGLDSLELGGLMDPSSWLSAQSDQEEAILTGKDSPINYVNKE